MSNSRNLAFALTLIVLLSNCQLCFRVDAYAQDASGAKPASKSAEKSGDKVAQVNTTPKTAKPAYIKAEPQSDPAGAPTRIHRPGTDGMPPVAPPAVGSPDNPMPLLKEPPTAPPREKFPSVGNLENMMFGHSSPNIAVENRLDKLEIAIFQKSSPNLDIEHRIHRLKEVIVGTEPPSSEGAGSNPYSGGGLSSGSGSRSGYANDPTAYAMPNPNPVTRPYSASPAPTAPEKQSSPYPFFENYGHYDLNQVLSMPEAEKFALMVINEVRSAQGLNELVWDDLGYKIATEHVADLSKRGAVSHQSSKGHNPDLRYSFAGGSDSLVESTIAFPQADNLKPTRQLVVKMLETLYGRQDDREAMLFPHANGYAMAFQWTPDKSKLLCVTETLTKHSEMQPIPLEASVGDRIEIKGSVKEPYHFHKLTLAWEGPVSPPDDSAESDEALPYFPPLDYEAHAVKSNRDFEKGIRFLQIAGITAAIAGGIFIPPVALAAPLIAASVGASTPKPVSEIPVRGGVKTDGSNFTHHLPLNNQGKEGIYYVTVWATTGSGNEMLPVSRRAIIARKEQPIGGADNLNKAAETGSTSSDDDQPKRKEKKSKKKKKDNDPQDQDKPAPTSSGDLKNGAETQQSSPDTAPSNSKESEAGNDGKNDQTDAKL